MHEDVVWASVCDEFFVYLKTLAADKGFVVRAAGVIDLGETKLLSAAWPSDPLYQRQTEDGDV